jgi:hypothetical protein
MNFWCPLAEYMWHIKGLFCSPILSASQAALYHGGTAVNQSLCLPGFSLCHTHMQCRQPMHHGHGVFDTDILSRCSIIPVHCVYIDQFCTAVKLVNVCLHQVFMRMPSVPTDVVLVELPSASMQLQPCSMPSTSVVIHSFIMTQAKQGNTSDEEWRLLGCYAMWLL